MFEFDYLITCKGGSRGNGATNQGYRTNVISTRNGQTQTVRLNLGTATEQRVCDPAEYETLLAALKDLSSRIQGAARPPPTCSLLIYTDSQLEVGQLTQGWQVKAAVVHARCIPGERFLSRGPLWQPFAGLGWFGPSDPSSSHDRHHRYQLQGAWNS